MTLDDYVTLKRQIVPRLRFNQDVYEDVVREEVSADTEWLDAGCGWHILPEWRESAEHTLVAAAKVAVGADVTEQAIRKHRTLRRRVVADLDALPFRSASLGLVTCNMVMEHVDHPRKVLAEFARVLRPGGKAIVHTPNAWSYYVLFARLVPWRLRLRLVERLERRAVEDVYPTRYRANTRSALRRLAHACGLVEERHRFVATEATMRAGHWLLAALELWIIRLTLSHALRRLRASMIVTLIKPQRA